MEMERPKMEEEEERRKKMKWPWMKSAQLLEFQVQALVYRYIEAGLRVPPHLLVPIWNSLARSSSSSSSSSSNYSIHHNLHSSLLSDNGLNHIYPVDPEPTRCRRTDGKKWRCSYTVLPFQKYCERHIHRGRKRSRKPVESSSYDTNNNETMSVSSNAQMVTVASFASTGPVSDHAVTCPSLTITNKNENNLPSIQKFFPEVSESAKTLSSNTKNVNGLFPSIHFSPDTVLQDNEPGRCRRTDGKKWRCSKEAISGQKYCDKHMHRGIKNKKKPMDTSVTVMGIPVLTRVSNEKSNSSSCSTDTTITDTALKGNEEEEEEVLSLCLEKP